MIPGTSAALDASLAFVEGDTWGGVPSTSYLVDGTPPSDDLASVKMEFRAGLTSSETLISLTSADGDITITSAANWEFTVPAQSLALLFAQSPYTWAIQTTDISGVIQTILKGNIEVLPRLVF